MKTATLSELQHELATQTPRRILEICLRLARHKKENKELLTYLLFEAQDEKAYIKSIKEDTELQFREMNQSNLYLAKKSIRKILRTTNKFIRFSGSRETEVELRIHFCFVLKNSGIPVPDSRVLLNLYENQVKKIRSIFPKLHDDLQYDYQKEMDGLGW